MNVNMKDTTTFYRRLSSLTRPKSYSGKILLIAFLGTHIPLITLFVVLTFMYPMEERFLVLGVALLATLIGSVLTLWFLYKLLAPVRMTNSAVIKYKDEKVVPDLPTGFEDEVGVLMANTQSMIEELHGLLSLKEKLISMISHDSKTPLGAIKMATELIEMDLPEQSSEGDIKNYLDIIRRSTSSHIEFLDNMISIARLNKKEITLARTKIDPEKLHEELYSNHKLYIEGKKLNYTKSIKSGDGSFIYADKQKLKSVLNNLLQNAIKFTPKEGSVKLEMSVSEEEAVIRVSDTGVGIPREKKEQLFQPFSDSSMGTAKEKGTGLGLWIAKLFTDLHQGEISVESDENGSVFTVRIPGK